MTTYRVDWKKKGREEWVHGNKTSESSWEVIKVAYDVITMRKDVDVRIVEITEKIYEYPFKCPSCGQEVGFTSGGFCAHCDPRE